MARKHGKGEEVNLFYLQEEKKKPLKTERKKVALQSQKKRKKTTTSSKKKETQKTTKFDFDEEFVIGVTRIPEEQEKPSKKERSDSHPKTEKQKKPPKKSVNEKNPKLTKKQEQRMKRNKKVKLVLKTILLIALIVGAIVFFLTSPVFNISNIKIVGNEKISIEEIEGLSQIEIGQNTYKIVKSKVIENIKQNPYIKTVAIKRSLPNTIIITVTERHAKYQLEYGSAYIYMDSQGYLLEVSENKLELPIITGLETEDINLQPGKRLEQSDLQKLDVVLKITEAAQINEISSLVTKIDISDKSDYKMILESEQKTVHLGDSTDINDRMFMVKLIIEKEKGNKGELFLTNNKDYWRFLPQE